MFSAFSFAGFPVHRSGNRDLFTPTGVYKTKDGHVAIACVGDKLFEDLCVALGLERLLTDPAFSTATARTANLRDLTEIIEKGVVTRRTDEVMQSLEKSGVPCTRVVERMEDVMENPQVNDREMLPKVMHPRMGEIVLTGIPYKLSESHLTTGFLAPLFGEHTEQILRELRYDEDQIVRLREKKAV
jgi:crotonobetainyl-CoA:carnitine CoA-transferase CaiB-like acyl-CoA transferase